MTEHHIVMQCQRCQATIRIPMQVTRRGRDHDGSWHVDITIRPDADPWVAQFALSHHGPFDKAT